MKNRRISRALACALLLSIAGIPSAAEAQHISRIIVLGDSYSDIGNALRLAGINPLSTQVYTTGRFSGGSNYVDTLSQILQVPQYNFAIGGANTGALQPSGLPGFQFEVQQFVSGGGALGFPAVNTTLTPSDLLALSIGGNDARYYQQGGGTLAGAPTAAAGSVTAFQQGLAAIMAKGSPTVSFLAGDTGQLPEVANNPSGAAIRTAFSTAYNAGAQQVLAGYAAKGSVVHYMDLTTILNNVKTDPAAYGITKGLVCPAFQPATPASSTCVVDASGYLFYGDLLHPTSTGMTIIGKYVARQLAAPLTLQAPSDMGLSVAGQWGRTLSTRTDLYGDGKGQEGLHFFVLGDGFGQDVSASNSNNAFEVRSLGGSVGAEYGMPGAMVGVAVNYSRPKVSFGTGDARDRGRTWQIGAFGAVSAGGLFGNAYLGYGRDRNRITRLGVVQDMSANPNGNHTVAGAKAGYLLSSGSVQVGPIVAANYARAKVGSYTEAGDPALTLNVSRQTGKSFTGNAGLELRGDLAGLKPYLDVTAEHEFNRNSRVITFSQTSAPVIVNSWNVSGRKQTYGRVSAGATADIAGMLSIDAAASATLSRKGGNQVGGLLGLRARF